MKKTIVILLMATLCFNSIGYFLMHSYIEHQIKTEIKARIKKSVPADELLTFILTSANASDFKWIDNKEFSYNSSMYDIVSKQENADGTILLYCISDEQETRLFKNLGKYVHNMMNSNSKSNQTGKILINLLTCLYLPVNFELQYLISEHWVIVDRYIYSYNIPDFSVASPPPKG